MIALYIIIGLFINLAIAAVVFTIVDTDKELYNWIWNQAPKTDNIPESIVIWVIQFLIITLWPITVYVYLVGRRRLS